MKRHPPRRTARCAALALFALISVGRCLAGEGAVEASLEVPREEALPRSFPVAVIHMRNRSASTTEVPLMISVSGPVHSVSPENMEVSLAPGEEKAFLHTLYVPPEASGGSVAQVRVQAAGQTLAAQIQVKTVASFKATAVSAETRFVHAGEKASFQVKLQNTGNMPLHFAFHAATAPEKAETQVTPENVVVRAGETSEIAVDVSLKAPITASATFVTILEPKAVEIAADAEKQLIYLQTEGFPEQTAPVPSALYEQLHGSFQFGVGGVVGASRRGADSSTFNEQLTLEGLIAEDTRMQLVESFTYPSSQRGELSSALSSLPNSSHRNFFHLGLFNPHWDAEVGEVTTAPISLLSPRETGDGARAAIRPLTDPAQLQIEAFAEENTLTLNRKDVFGAEVSGHLKSGALEYWRAGILSKRNDVGPQGANWDSIGLNTGWKLPVSIPLRAQVSAAFGQNSEGGNGGAWAAALHYNGTLPGERDDSPVKAGVEFAYGDRMFPGAQNGREDRRAYLSYRILTEPSYLEAYANYNDSRYEVVPNIERTLEEEQDIVPDFLQISQSRLLTAGVRWRRQMQPHACWEWPSGQLEYQETTSFNRADFFDRARENALALTLQPFSAPRRFAGGDVELEINARGGVENRASDNAPRSESRFLTFGGTVRYTRAAPSVLERIAGASTLAFEASTRYTENLDGDREALNRTGISGTASGVWQGSDWSAKFGTTFYSYESAGLSDRVWASIERKVSKNWWAGVQAAFTHHDTTAGDHGAPNEGAVMLTFRHDFDLAVPWLPRRGQVAGQVFDDANNNGRRDLEEKGIEGVKVAVGKTEALSGSDGKFTFPPMEKGDYPLAIMPSAEVHYESNAEQLRAPITLAKGAVRQLSIPLVKPTSCEGRVRLAVAKQKDPSIAMLTTRPDGDISGVEIIATGRDGVQHRGFTRADGFFSLDLKPGRYDLTVNTATLKPQQTVSPARVAVTVERHRIENLAFTVTDHPKQIRRTFSGGNP